MIGVPKRATADHAATDRGTTLVDELAATPRDGAWSFDRTLEDVAFDDETVVRLRCRGARDLRVELIGFLL